MHPIITAIVFSFCTYTFLNLVLVFLGELRQYNEKYNIFMFQNENNTENLTFQEKVVFNWLGGCGFCFCAFWGGLLSFSLYFFVDLQLFQLFFFVPISAGLNSFFYQYFNRNE